MLTKERLSARFGTKAEFRKLRESVTKQHPDAFLCFCFDGNRLLWCDGLEEGRYCHRRHNEVTDYFNQWLDGYITRGQLVSTLLAREVQEEPNTRPLLVTRE